MKLSLHLVTWNGAKYIPYLFASLKAQTHQDWELLILDNGSTDKTVELIEKELSTFNVQYRLVVNTENAGFAGGHNALWRESRSDYALLLNQDLYLIPECIERLVSALDQLDEAAAIAPRLMRWQFPDGFTDEIDSLGMRVGRSRRVIEDCSGLKWSDVQAHCSDRPLEVFGVSGAMMMLRRSMLDEVALDGGNIFDPDYGSYKEDVDLAFRLQARGRRSFVAPVAIAHHDRSASPPRSSSDLAAAAKKITQSLSIQKQSYRNHLMTLYKNEYWQNLLLDFPWIIWYELKKFFWFLIFDRRTLAGLVALWRERKLIIRRRYEIKRTRTRPWQEIRRWWSNSERIFPDYEGH